MVTVGTWLHDTGMVERPSTQMLKVPVPLGLVVTSYREEKVKGGCQVSLADMDWVDVLTGLGGCDFSKSLYFWHLGLRLCD